MTMSAMRTSFIVECEAVDEHGDIRDVEGLDAIEDDLLLNHRSVVEPNTIVFLRTQSARHR